MAQRAVRVNKGIAIVVKWSASRGGRLPILGTALLIWSRVAAPSRAGAVVAAMCKSPARRWRTDGGLSSAIRWPEAEGTVAAGGGKVNRLSASHASAVKLLPRCPLRGASYSEGNEMPGTAFRNRARRSEWT